MCLGQDACAAPLIWLCGRDIWKGELNGMEFYFNEYNEYVYRS